MMVFFTYLRNYSYFKLTSVAKKVNGLIYYLKKLPLIGKKIPIALYRYYPVKQAIATIAFILSLLFSAFNKFIWLAMYTGIAALIESVVMQENVVALLIAFKPSVLANGLFLWFVLNVLFLGFYNRFAMIPDKKTIDFYEEFLLSRTVVVRGDMLLDVGYQGIAYLPAALVFGRLFGQELSVVFFIFFSYLAGNYFFSLLGRIVYIWKFSAVKRKIFGAIVGLSLIVIGGLIEYFRIVQPIMTILLSWWGIVLLFVLLIGILRLLLTFKRENDFLLYWIEHTSLNLETLNDSAQEQNQYLAEGLTMQKKLVVTSDQVSRKLSGSQYLNSLLFSRYRSILNKALLFRFYFIVTAWVLIILASLFGFFNKADNGELVKTFPNLFFVMYMASFGKKVVQMVFVNCDVSMLYYPFYREASTILAGFNYRFKQTFYYNSIVSAGIFIGYMLLQVMNDFFLSWQFFGMLLLLLIALSFLFSFHELFVYYIIQPFTGDMEVVSPLYKIISGVFYWISYMNIQLHSVGYFYVTIVVLCCLVYVLVGFIVIYKKAPKTFRIKT
ncbi:hypothetical protein ATZ33_02270 [Enterococcus silesiacus]|uniref:ABC transporter permease n=1 Tax=Enterococcus silesiacus TaxID=332949 RepID=A0A0S3K7N5_9ENTE|nr:hypothetical protein [Enterococcus silesiacus]ALS00242.1 hypothetical protein ATZ33_02270 [Enterococcus silesiacus]OJG93222.1 hypothetical protein RV15_GL001254 [Enterococcus silesiacus]